MRSGTDGYIPRQQLGPLLLCLLLVLHIPAASSKYACSYSNSLCQWQSSYAFAATAVEDKVFYHGGAKANSPGAVNSVNLEVLDLQSLSPLLVNAQRSTDVSETLISSRYSHQLTTWKDRLLLFGGKHENAPWVAEDENIAVFDLNNRTWSWLKGGRIKLPMKGEFYSVLLYEAVAVSGNTLLAVVQSITTTESSRSLMALDLDTGKDSSRPLPGNNASVAMLDWRLVGLLAGLVNQSALVVQAKRSIPSCSPDSINWSATDDAWRHSAVNVSCEATTTLKRGQAPARTSTEDSSTPQVLVLKLLRLQGRPSLVMLAKTVATFEASAAGGVKQNALVVLVHDIVTHGSSSSGSSTTNKTRSLSLQLRHLLLTPPLGRKLSQLRSVVLPLHGPVLVGPGDGVVELPYVGDVGLVSPADSSNANIQEVPDGFVIRGLGRADQSCQPGADWAPFLIHVGFKGQGRPAASARSNYSWCVTRPAQAVAEQVVADIDSMSTNGQLLSVDGSNGPLLMLVGPHTRPNAGLHPSLFPWLEAPYMGTFINLRDSRVHKFTVALDKSYNLTRPSRICSCVTSLNQQPVYVEAGGAYYDDARETYGTNKGVFTMDVLGPGRAQHQLLRAAGGDVIPQRAQAALACAPDGQVWMFGGAVLVSAKEGTWAPSDELVALRISRSGAAAGSNSSSSSSTGTRAAVEVPIKHRRMWPGPRSGHALVYLQPALAQRFGCAKGALLMYGGSDIHELSMANLRSPDNTNSSEARTDTGTDAGAEKGAAKGKGKAESPLYGVVHNATWDTQLWLYDVAAKRWFTLEATRTPPHLMYHGMTIAGSQLVIFGGQQRMDDRMSPIQQSTYVHVVDLGVTPLRWRAAPVANNATSMGYGLDAHSPSFPSTSAVSVPGQRVVALKHNKDLYVIPLPQTLKVTPTPANLARWGLTSLNVTAGDWVRLEATGQQPVPLQQPLMLFGDVIFTGAVVGAAAGQEAGAAAGAPTLQCAAAAANSTAISIRSAGVAVENFVVRGCKGIAVDVTFPSTTASIADNLALAGKAGVKLRNLTFVANNGVALLIGRNVSINMRRCVFRNNTAPANVVRADRGSRLEVEECSFIANAGTALVFNGSNLTIANSSFANNSASIPALRARMLELQSSRAGRESTSQVAEMAALGLAADAGALRIPQDMGRELQSSFVRVTNTSFTGNVGGAGGAVFLGSNSGAFFKNCTFTGNAAKWLGGGAIFTFRDACLMVFKSRFLRNTAQPSTWGGINGTSLSKLMHHGGAIWMQNPACGLDFKGATFEGNVAHSEGGAVSIKDLTSRSLNFSGCSFSANKALNGPGGAISLHAVSSKVDLASCTMLNNTASEGGALYIRSTSTAVNLDKCIAAGNKALGDAPANASFKDFASHHGGALSMSGSVSELTLKACNFSANKAQGQGGAMYITGSGGEQGDTTSGMFVHVGTNSTFSKNTADRNGGAIHVATALLLVSRAQLSRNAVNITVQTPVTSASGGGLYCDECVVTIRGSTFVNNTAALGGGAAVLRAENANITSAIFEANTADASAGVSPAATSATPFSSRPSEQEARYLGGGGLYLETDECNLANLTFTQNTAPVAGSLYLQLREGKGTAKLLNVKLAPSAGTTTTTSSSSSSDSGGTSGLLFNGPISRMLVPGLCEDPSSSSSSHAKCVAEAMATWQEQAFTRRLPQEDAASLMPSDPSSNPTTAAARSVFATTAVQLKLVRWNTQAGVWEPESTVQRLVASGEPLPDLHLQLMDALGFPVHSDLSDATMLVVANVYSDGVRWYNISMIGNVTNAVKSVATFSGMRICMLCRSVADLYDVSQICMSQIWPPNVQTPSLQLRFDSATGLERRLELPLQTNCTGCKVGQYTKLIGEGQQANATGTYSVKFDCPNCRAPLYSFIPEAEQCSVCPAKAVCHLYYAIPLNGSYQSHPRNPLILDCLLPAACTRSGEQQKRLEGIVENLRTIRTGNITQEAVNAYHAAMCNKGYEGPLCGACSKGYGRADIGCTRCFSPSVHAVLFVLVGVVMLAWVLIQGWLHVSQVNRNHADVKTQVLATYLQHRASQLAQGSGPGQATMGSQGTAQLPATLNGSMQLQPLQGQQQQLQGPDQQQQQQQGVDQGMWPRQRYQEQMMELQTLGHVLPKHPHQQYSQQYSLPEDAQAFGQASSNDVQRQPDANHGFIGRRAEPWLGQHQIHQYPEQQPPPQQQQQQRARPQPLQVPHWQHPSQQDQQQAGGASEQQQVQHQQHQHQHQHHQHQVQQQLVGSYSSSHPDSLTIASPWAVLGRDDPDVAVRLASDNDSRQNSTGSGGYPSVTQQQQQQQPGQTTAELGSLRNRYPLAGPPVQQQQQQRGSLPAAAPIDQTATGIRPAGSGHQANALALPAAAGAAAAAAAAGSGAVTGGGLPPCALQAAGFATLPVASSIALQLRSAVSSMFSTNVLHDAARMRWSTAAFSSQQMSQGTGGTQKQQQGVPAGEHVWIADMFKLLTSHLQLLGLLRPLRIKWPEALQKLLQHVDPSSALMAWARLDCSMAEADRPGAPRRSIQRSIVLLLSPVVAAGAVAVLWCLWVAYETIQQRRQRDSEPVQSVRAYRWHYLVLYVVLTLFFLYPQVSKEIVSTLSCHPVDNPQKFMELMPPSCTKPGTSCNMTEAQTALRYTERYWSNDTLVECFKGQHWVVLALGVLGLAFFALGLPIGLFVALTKARSANCLEEREVELQLGFLYASYRRRYDFWEGVVLLEKLAMVLSITLLQGVSVGLQVLMAIAVIFVSASLQVTFQPFACKLLDTLQRISFYTLQITLFLLMVASFDKIADEGACMTLFAVVAVLNAAVLVVFVFFIGRGVRLMLANSRLGWAKVSSWCRENVAGPGWMDTMTGNCEGCFKIRETATTSPTTNHNSHAVPPAFSGQQSLS